MVARFLLDHNQIGQSWVQDMGVMLPFQALKIDRHVI